MESRFDCNHDDEVRLEGVDTRALTNDCQSWLVVITSTTAQIKRHCVEGR